MRLTADSESGPDSRIRRQAACPFLDSIIWVPIASQTPEVSISKASTAEARALERSCRFFFGKFGEPVADSRPSIAFRSCRSVFRISATLADPSGDVDVEAWESWLEPPSSPGLGHGIK